MPRIRTLLVPGVLLAAGAGLLALVDGTPRHTLPTPPAEATDRAAEEVLVAVPVEAPVDLDELLARAAREPRTDIGAHLDAGEGTRSLLRVTRESPSAEARALATALLVVRGELDHVVAMARTEANPDVRRAAIYSLAAGGGDALDLLEHIATTDPDPGMAEAAVHALAAANTAEAHEALERALRAAAGAPDRRAAVYRAIEGVRPGAFPWDLPWFRMRFCPERPSSTDPERPEAMARLVRLVSAEPLPGLHAAATSALLGVGGRPAASELAGMWVRADSAERAAILRRVRRHPSPAVLGELFTRAPETKADERRRLAAIAVELDAPTARESLEKWCDREPERPLREKLAALLDSWSSTDDPR